MFIFLKLEGMSFKGTEKREDLAKVYPELEARSLDPQSRALYSDYPLCHSINYVRLYGT